MKTMRYGMITGITLLFVLTACDNFFHELIPNDFPRITEFELNEQPESDETYIGEDTIGIPWRSGMNIERQTIRHVSIPAKASLLPVTPDYIQAAFPRTDTDEAIKQINTATDIAACIKKLIKGDSDFNVPELNMPIDFSSSVTLLVIGGRGTVWRYTANIIVHVRLESSEDSDIDPDPIAVIYGKTIPKPPDPSGNNYIFVGWYAEDGEAWDFDTVADRDITLYAKWGANIYYVTFESEMGDPIPVQTVIEGGKAVAPVLATVNGYRIGGWYRDAVTFKELWDFDADTVTGDITLYAKWDKGYTVTFEFNGGTPDLSGDTPVLPYQFIVEGGKARQPADPSKSGHVFGGWYQDNQFNQLWNFDTVVSADITLYAQWTANLYSVKFDSNGGTEIAGQSVSHGGTITRPSPNPARAGYTFDNWYYESRNGLLEVYNFSWPVTDDIILYAKWISS